jgi:hypothetical protein
MRFLTSALIALVGHGVLTAASACENPTMVQIPDGATATMEQLLEAQTHVKTYMTAMEEYLACLNEEVAAAGEDAPAEFKAMMVTRHNAGVTEMESVAAAFNEEVKAFKEANPDPAASQSPGQ